MKGEAPNWMVDRILSGPITKTVPDGEMTNYQLDGLEPETYYKVDIVAVNSIGESPLATKIFKTSKAANGQSLFTYSGQFTSSCYVLVLVSSFSLTRVKVSSSCYVLVLVNSFSLTRVN